MSRREWARGWIGVAGVVSCALIAGAGQTARADDAGGASDAGAAPASAPRSPQGVAVLALPGAERAAWALAKDVYARASLRPSALDEARARVLVGEPAPAGAAQDVLDVRDERAGVHGDDGASRALLRTLASQLGVKAIVVVDASAPGAPVARVFLAESGSFDAAQYTADAPGPGTLGGSTAPPAASLASGDAGAPASSNAASDGGSPVVAPIPSAPPPRWTKTVASLDRGFGESGKSHESHETSVPAPALATAEIPPAKAPASEGSRPFYTSPWFWGAVGAAVFGGTAVYFATRDNTSGTIHLELQVPK